MQLSLFQAAVAASLFVSASAGLAVLENQVKTTSGTIVGHQAYNRTSVTEFLGIRYGQIPVGNLRFALPQRYVAPAGTLFEALDWVCESL
jgi:hypothetical protein